MAVRPSRAAVLAGLLVLLAAPSTARSEGSVDINTGNPALVRHILTMAGAGLSLVPPYTVLRVYARAGERIEMGSSAMGLGGESDILVYPPGASFNAGDAIAPLNRTGPFASPAFDCNADSTVPGRGVLNSRGTELAGPGGPNGYTPCTFTAPANGIYAVVMFPYDTTNGSGVANGTITAPNVTNNQKLYLSLWDVTVVNASGNHLTGRVFTNNLAIRAGGNENNVIDDFHAYALTPTGYVYDVTFFNHSGINWNLVNDNRGVVSKATGRPLYASFNSKDAAGASHSEAYVPSVLLPDTATDPRFPTFFNPPDPVVVTGAGGLGETERFAATPISPATPQLSSIQFMGEGQSGGPGQTTQGLGGSFSFTSPPALNGMTYDVGIDFDRDGSFSGAADFVSKGNPLSDSGNVLHWNGLTGAGEVPACGSYPAHVAAALSEVHFTQSDVENSGGTRIQRLTLPNDPALDDPRAAGYDDVDPFKGVAVTNTSIPTVAGGLSGPGFHSWTANSGDNDYIDTWARLPAIQAAGAVVVAGCPAPAPPTYDLEIRKVSSHVRVEAGATFTYTLTVRNRGPEAAPADAIVADRAPGIVTVLDVRSDRGRCAHRGNDVTCDVGHLAAGVHATVTITARAGAPGSSRNIAVVGLPPRSTPVDRLANNAATARVAVVVPALELSKSGAPLHARRRQAITFVLRARNPSRSAVRNVLVCDRLPRGLRFAGSSPTARSSGRLRCWRVPTLGAGLSRAFTVRANVTGRSGAVVNRAFAAAPLASTARASRRVVIAPRRVRPRFTG